MSGFYRPWARTCDALANPDPEQVERDRLQCENRHLREQLARVEKQRDALRAEVERLRLGVER